MTAAHTIWYRSDSRPNMAQHRPKPRLGRRRATSGIRNHSRSPRMSKEEGKSSTASRKLCYRWARLPCSLKPRPKSPSAQPCKITLSRRKRHYSAKIATRSTRTHRLHTSQLLVVWIALACSAHRIVWPRVCSSQKPWKARLSGRRIQKR